MNFRNDCSLSLINPHQVPSFSHRIGLPESILPHQSGGWLFFEIHPERSHEVAHILAENGFTDVKTLKDINDRDRICGGRAEREKH
jgi:methylase of polypeptide subunit release factors